MNREPAWRRYLRFGGDNPKADLDAELDYHVERRIAEYMSAGLSRAEAQSAAAERLGDLDAVRAACEQIAHRGERKRRRIERLQLHWTELRHAGRRLRRRPGFAASATVTLGLGIGAATCIFAVVNSVLLEPLPSPDSDRLVSLSHTAPGLGFEDIGQGFGGFDSRGAPRRDVAGE